MKVTTDNGHTYTLTFEACVALLDAQTANVADGVFNAMAPHIPARDRLGVWVAVETA